MQFNNLYFISILVIALWRRLQKKAAERCDL